MTKRGKTRATKRATAEDTRQATADEARRQMADAMNSGNRMLASAFGSVGQITAAAMIRTQLERIADASELKALCEQIYDGKLDHKEIDRRRDSARCFLRDKILARIEREKLAADGAAATVTK